MLLSVLPVGTRWGAPTDDVMFTSAGFSFALRVPEGGQAQVRSLRNATTGFEWCRSGTPVEPVLASANATHGGWTSRRVSRRGERRVELVARESGSSIETTTAVQTFADVPVVEFQTEFRNTAATPLTAVTAFGPLRFALRDDLGALQVHAIARTTYNVETNPVTNTVEVSGGQWNSPGYGGLVVLEAVDKNEFLFLGIEWEHGWRYRIETTDKGRWLSIDVADLTHDLAPGERLSTPRVFLGLAHGDRDDAFLTAQHYLKQHVLLKPLKNWPWVVYNFWGTEAKGVEDILLREIDFAAKLGVELFYQDAAWYEGSSVAGDGDWFPGLGSYKEDRRKFPNGLAAISRKVHERGMKFGLWVGPNLVDSRNVGTLIPQQWLAQVDGQNQSQGSALQVCLGCRGYVEYLKTQLSGAIERFDLDWLKWDNSGIPGAPANGCNRTDHGHQAGDASYAALVGQYEIFDHLHAKFPHLVLEQCGYGSRVDYGLARTIRANWLNDSSNASSVRHNATGASYLYPSSYNGGWVVSAEQGDDALLDTAYRSRMLGLFGFGTEGGKLAERVSLYPAPMLAAAQRNIPLYKRYRHLLQEDCYHLLSAGNADDQWQVLQFVSPSGDEAVVLAFRGQGQQDAVRVPLRGVDAKRQYELTFANTGTQQQMHGRDLLHDGLALSLARPGMSDVVLLKAR